MYKAIIFDFFGVFCPDITLEWFKTLVPDYAEKLPAFHSICRRSDNGQLSKVNFYKEISLLANISVDQVVLGVEAGVVINGPLVTFVEKIKKEGYKTACLSNGTQEWTLDVIRKHGLTKLFDEIVLSGDLAIVKPDPRIYFHTLEKLDVPARHAVFVDDREININAAEGCGIRSILFKDTAMFIKDFEILTTAK